MGESRYESVVHDKYPYWIATTFVIGGSLVTSLVSKLPEWAQYTGIFIGIGLCTWSILILFWHYYKGPSQVLWSWRPRILDPLDVASQKAFQGLYGTGFGKYVEKAHVTPERVINFYAHLLGERSTLYRKRKTSRGYEVVDKEIMDHISSFRGNAHEFFIERRHIKPCIRECKLLK